jgi:hypothetical protein
MDSRTELNPSGLPNSRSVAYRFCQWSSPVPLYNPVLQGRSLLQRPCSPVQFHGSSVQSRVAGSQPPSAPLQSSPVQSSPVPWFLCTISCCRVAASFGALAVQSSPVQSSTRVPLYNRVLQGRSLLQRPCSPVQFHGSSAQYRVAGLQPPSSPLQSSPVQSSPAQYRPTVQSRVTGLQLPSSPLQSSPVQSSPVPLYNTVLQGCSLLQRPCRYQFAVPWGRDEGRPEVPGSRALPPAE